jgi:hypothetical protein
MNFILSDGSKNSWGFRLDMTKLSLDRFKGNPVLLYNHNELIGRWTNIVLEGDKLYAEPEFMSDETETVALKVKKRVEEGFVKGASLGINILSVTYIDNEPPLVEAEVLECSIVDVPSNKNALRVLSAEGEELTDEEIQTQLSAFKPELENPTELINQNSMKLNASTIAILGLSATFTEIDVDNAVLKISTELQALKDKQKSETDARIETMLSAAIKAGKILATEKENYALQAQENFAFVESVIEKLPAKSNLSGKELGGTPSEDGRDDWNFEKWRKEDTKGLLSIKANDPERYAQIVNKK